MAKFDPFEQEFRRQAQGLSRDPSVRTWDRLERRLDRRRAPVRVFRPWMVAALLVLAAGLALVSDLGNDRDSPLAQRSERMEELSAPYVPVEDFEPGVYHGGNDARPASSLDIPVNEKYRG